MPVPAAQVLLHRLTVIPFPKEALYESSFEDHHLSSLVLLSVPATSSHTNWDEDSQTKEALGCSVALRQLQMVTQAKSQPEWELLLKQEELAPKQEDQQARMAKKQENQWARMAEQGDTTFREVLSQVSQANLVRLLPWFLFTTASPGAVPLCSVSETLTTIMQSGADAPVDTTPEFKGSQVLASTSIPVN